MFISFIVPVYNVEKYLPECLDSLLDQDIPKEDYEIICVNDGSTDGSMSILQNYAQKYSNIRIIDQENGGICVARNTGVDAARGEYIWFVDSDDFIQRNCLGDLKRLAEKTQCDRVSFGVYSFREMLSEEELNEVKQGRLLTNTGLNNIAVWNNLFRLLHLKKYDLRFHPELRYAEDGIYMFEFSLVDHVEVQYKNVCYYYRLRAKSLTTANTYADMKNKIEGDFAVVKRYKRYYLNQQGNPQDIADKLMANLWHLLFTISQLPDEKRREQINQLKKDGFYPFERPDACTIKKSYMTTRTDFVGKVFDKVYINMHRPWGFAAMVLLQRIIKAKNKLVK